MRRPPSLYLRPFLITCMAMLALIPMPSLAQDATPAGGEVSDGVTVVANGLTNPRGFTFGADGTLYLALAGTGGDDQVSLEGTPAPFFGGQTSSIVTVADGCTTPIAEGWPSIYWEEPNWIWGVMDVAILEGELYALHGGGLVGWGLPESPNGVYHVLEDGTWELVADLGTWFSENPPAFVPWDYDPTGSLFAIEAGVGKLWVTEAVGGRLMTVTPDGQIELVADLSEGHLVPTGIALDGEGGAYVGFLTAAPYADASSKVMHVAADGTVTDHWTGLTTVTGLAMGPDGVLYAAEMATDNLAEEPFLNPGTGRVVRQTGPDSLEVVVTDADFPAALGFDANGSLHVTGPTFAPERGEGQGWLVQIDPAAAPVSLAGISEAEPTCGDASTAMESQDTASATEAAVSIVDFAFDQATLEISAGTTVTWTNNDVAPHTVTSTNGLFDSGRLNQGDTFSRTFDSPGEHAYLCEYHPGMQGTIVVT